MYTVQGGGIFAMARLTTTTPALLKLYKDIGSEENPYILKIYKIEKNDNPVVTCTSHCTEFKKDGTLVYWEYLNYDLTHEVKKKYLCCNPGRINTVNSSSGI